MTLLTDIQSAQSSLIRPFVTKPLLIRTPLAVVQEYLPNNLYLYVFDPDYTTYGDTSNFVYLRLFPQYEAADETQGERGYFPSYSGTVIRNSTTKTKFKVLVQQQQYFIFQIINQLARIANSSIPHTPIKVIDFCRPDSNPITYPDGKASVRYGRIDIEQPPSAIRSTHTEFTKNPWLFTFEDYRLRLN